jgi:hypothetical protein
VRLELADSRERDVAVQLRSLRDMGVRWEEQVLPAAQGLAERASADEASPGVAEIRSPRGTAQVVDLREVDSATADSPVAISLVADLAAVDSQTETLVDSVVDSVADSADLVAASVSGSIALASVSASASHSSVMVSDMAWDTVC